MTAAEITHGPGYGALENVPPDVLGQMVDYVGWASSVVTGKQDWRIPSMVAEQWAISGFAVIGTNEFSRRFGVSRRTVCMYLRRLQRDGLIRQVGLTPTGQSMFAPCIKRGATAAPVDGERGHGN